jgi:hypothetical protein
MGAESFSLIKGKERQAQRIVLGQGAAYLANLATTQRYLGKVTDLDAMRWIKSLHG